jgi:hypothetical protein
MYFFQKKTGPVSCAWAEDRKQQQQQRAESVKGMQAYLKA